MIFLRVIFLKDSPVGCDGTQSNLVLVDGIREALFQSVGDVLCHGQSSIPDPLQGHQNLCSRI